MLLVMTKKIKYINILASDFLREKDNENIFLEYLDWNSRNSLNQISSWLLCSWQPGIESGYYRFLMY